MVTNNVGSVNYVNPAFKAEQVKTEVISPQTKITYTTKPDEFVKENKSDKPEDKKGMSFGAKAAAVLASTALAAGAIYLAVRKGRFAPLRNLPEHINFTKASTYEEAIELSGEIDIKVFLGVELSYGGTDFLVYGLDKQWYLDHPEIMTMKKSEELKFLIEHGALVIQAHPFREAGYIDHIRLYPRHVHGVETVNACRTELENKMAAIYAENYGLRVFAGSDNHVGCEQTKLAGMRFDDPLKDEVDFVCRVIGGQGEIFTADLSDCD